MPVKATRKTAAQKKFRRRRISTARKSLLELAAGRLRKLKSRRPGVIVLRLRGRGGGTYGLLSKGGTVEVLTKLPRAATPPLIELICEADAFEDILGEGADPLAAFLNGRFRVRGDASYMLELGRELGFLPASG